MKRPIVILSQKKYALLKQAKLESEKLNSAINNATCFIDNIKNGSLDVDLDQLDSESSLGQVLKDMQFQMNKIAKEENERTWVSEGLAKFIEILRADNSNNEKLYDNILGSLVKYLGANQGAIFLLNNEIESDPFIELVSCYAYDRKKYINKRIEMGEGLVGQSYLEADTLYFTDIPDNYISISSGLGGAQPNCLLIVPLKLNNKIFGVIELAGFKQFKPFQINFIEKLGESIAATIANIQTNRRTESLLKIAQVHAEEMRSTEEEMRQNMEELSATQEEMHRKEVAISGVFNAIDSALASIEFDMDKRVLTANKKFLDLMEYSLSEIQGKPHAIFVTKDDVVSDDYKNFWINLKNGIAETDDFKRISKTGKIIWLRSSYTPVMDVNGKYTKIIKLATDITEKKNAEIEFKKLSLVADNTDNSVIITNCDGLVEYVNQGFINITGFTLQESLNKKPGDFLQGPDTDPSTVERIREKLSLKEPFTEEILNYNKNGESYWISLAINPIFDKDGQLEKFISIQANITQTKLQALDFNCKIEAIEKAYGVVEFDTLGNVLSANENFLNIMGYQLTEIVGRHHSIFVEEREKESDEYKEFWKKLGIEGEFITGQFKRIGKDGNEIWLKGSYNAILNLKGKPYKVIKYAQNITEEKNLELMTNMQADILKQNMEELSAAQELVKKKQKDSEIVAQKYQQILESCADAVVMNDEKGIISFFNIAAEKLWGYQREEVLGKKN